MLKRIRNFFDKYMPLGGAEAGRDDMMKAGDWSEWGTPVDHRVMVLPPGLKYTPARPPQTSIQAVADMVS